MKNGFRWIASAQTLVLGAGGLSFATAQVPDPNTQASSTMTISTAVDAAYSYNPDVRAARERLIEQQAVESGAYSRLFPTISTTGSGTYRKDASNGNAAFGGDAYNSYRLSLDANQVLYDGGASFAALRQVSKERRVREYDVQIAERGVAIQVIQAFYTVILNRHRVENLERNHALQKKVLATAEDRYRIGRGQLLDVLSIKTQLALLEPQIAEAKNNLAVAVASLANLTGVPGGKGLQIQGALELPLDTAELNPSRSGAVLELERIHVQQEQFSDVRSFSMAKHYPQLGATGTVARTAFVKSDLLEPYSTSWAVGLQLTVPLFSGLSSKADRRQLASQESQLTIQEKKIADQNVLDRIKSEYDLELRRELVEATRKAAEFALASQREAEKNYRLQTTDFLQMLQAEQNNLQAQISSDQAKFNYVTAVANYFVTHGLPLADVIQWLQTKTLARKRG